MSIDITVMGEYAIGTYEERAFKSAWYGLAEVWGNFVQLQRGEKWGNQQWGELKAVMVENFGSAEAPKISTEQLVQFSMEYFDKDLAALLETNRNSFKKREEYKKAV